jgi:AraC-like DNA-binding protein
MTDENTHALASDSARRLAAAFTSLVEAEYRSGQSINEYASKLGVTPTHLTRSCKQACGRPASAILADRVHFEARKLLRETQRPVKDIASALGFSSAAYFTRAFQKHTGLTPSAFRRDL